MSYTLSLIRMYGHKLLDGDGRDHDVDDLEEFDGDDLLDKMTGMSESENWAKRKRARDALGVTFELYSWGDEMPWALAVTESMEEVYDDGIMRVDAMPPVLDGWDRKLAHVVERTGLKVDGPPGWFFLARYF